MSEGLAFDHKLALDPIQADLRQHLNDTIAGIRANTSGEILSAALTGRADQVSKDAQYFFDPNLEDSDSTALSTAGAGYLDGSLNRDEYFELRQKALPIVWLREGIETADGLHQFNKTEQSSVFPALKEVAHAFGRYEQTSSSMLPPTLPSGKRITSPIKGNTAKMRNFKTFEGLIEASRRLNTFRTIPGMNVDGWLDIEDPHHQHQHVYYPGNTDPTNPEDYVGEHEFKIHLMPPPEKVIEITEILATFANQNTAFKQSIHSFKSSLESKIDNSLPTPEIVVYPIGTELAVTAVLGQLLKLFDGQQGTGQIPRFNNPVDDGKFVFLAQGDGFSKVESYLYQQGAGVYLGDPGGEQYVDKFSADLNYAFNKADLELADRIIANAKNS